MQFKRWK